MVQTVEDNCNLNYVDSVLLRYSVGPLFIPLEFLLPIHSWRYQASVHYLTSGFRYIP